MTGAQENSYGRGMGSGRREREGKKQDSPGGRNWEQRVQEVRDQTPLPPPPSKGKQLLVLASRSFKILRVQGGRGGGGVEGSLFTSDKLDTGKLKAIDVPDKR